jgi:hypothetical protein
MKSGNIYARLKKLGYNVDYGKFGYWDNVTKVKIDTKTLWVAETWTQNGTTGVRTDFKLNDVLDAINDLESYKDEYMTMNMGDLNEKLPKRFQY